MGCERAAFTARQIACILSAPLRIPCVSTHLVQKRRKSVRWHSAQVMYVMVMCVAETSGCSQLSLYCMAMCGGGLGR